MPETPRPHTGSVEPEIVRANEAPQDPVRDVPRPEAIVALSAVSGNYSRETSLAGGYQRGTTPPGRQQRVTLLLPAFGAIAVGFVLLIAGRNTHLCGATFRLPRTMEPALRDLCRNTLYDVVSADADFSGGVIRGRPFFVDFPTQNTLRFASEAPKGDTVVDQAARLADRFLVRIEHELRRARETPSEGEIATAAHITAIESALAEERLVLEQSVANAPKQDQRAERDGLMKTWRALREEYGAAELKLLGVARSVEQLRTAGPPSHGIVSADERRVGFAADLGLHQDLKELTVALTEVRGHLARLFTDTKALHAQLEEAATKLARNLQSVETGKMPRSIANDVATFLKDSGTFRESLSAFSAVWTLELAAIRALQIDPRSQELLDRYDRTRSALGAFLFDSSKILAKMRGSTRGIETAETDNGRVMQVQAGVSRSFQTLQTLYHRFEFAASQVDRSQHFRLDAALRSASGLRRRSQKRMLEIDQALEQKALQRMTTIQDASLRQAQALLDRARSEKDAKVATLVDLQDELATRTGSVEAFVAAAARTEMANRNVESLQKTLGEANERLRELQARRRARGQDTEIELAATGILGPPINVAQRLRNSAIGAALALLGLLLGQWWVARKS